MILVLRTIQPVSKFENTNINLAGGLIRNVKVHKTKVCINIKDCPFRTILYVVPSAKYNWTSLGPGVLRNAWTVLDVANQNWYFIRNSKNKFHFVKDSFRPMVETDKRLAAVNEKKKAKTSLKMKVVVNKLLVINVKIFDLQTRKSYTKDSIISCICTTLWERT